MATYYVSDATGNDGDDGLSEGNAWLTIDHAMNNVAAGDTVWVKADGTYSEIAAMDTVGTAAAPIIIEGYTTTTGDNGKVSWTGTTSCLLSSLASAYYIWKNFIFQNCSSHGISSTSTDACAFVNCEFNSNGGHGVTFDQFNLFLNCIATGNTQAGIEAGNSCVATGCISYSNTQNQILFGTTAIIHKCVAYGLPNSASYPGLKARHIIDCTIDGENQANSVGVELDNVLGGIWNSIVYDCNVGVNQAASAWLACAPVVNNLVNSNGTDYEQTGGIVGFQDVTSAPAFTDEASDDYTLGEASPARAAGIKPGGIT
jgi:hypothetical protein